MRSLFILFFTVPLVEMYILIQVGQSIGALVTIGLVVLTAMLGITLLKYQGIAVLSKAGIRLRAGQAPLQEIIEGMLLAVGGALLLTPGFVTDAMGFACLIPPLRRYLAQRLVNYQRFATIVEGNGQGRQQWSQHPEHEMHEPHIIIEGEYTHGDKKNSYFDDSRP